MSLLPEVRSGWIFRCDAFCKQVLKNANRNILRNEKRFYDRHFLFFELDEEIETFLYEMDEYEVLKLWITIDELSVAIESEMLHHALKMLSERKLKIILMSYFSELTDKQIGAKMQIPKSTVQYNRVAALHILKKYMEEWMDEDEKHGRRF